VGDGIKDSIDMGLLSVNLVGKGTVSKLGNRDIQKGKGVVLLGFHRELYVRGNFPTTIQPKNHLSLKP